MKKESALDTYDLWSSFRIAGSGETAAIGVIFDTLSHADDLASRAIDAVGRRDLEQAASDFERCLTVHTHTAVQTASKAITARLRGDDSHADILGPLAALMLWQIPARARIACGVLKAAARPKSQDPTAKIRIIAEGALRRPETRTLLGEPMLERLKKALNGAFSDPISAAIVEPLNLNRTAQQMDLRNPASMSKAALSKREREVLRGISEGLTNREIASRLGIQGITVNTFVSRIFGKLGLDNRAAAAAYAVRYGLCDI